jgi:hypothetical protein
VAVDVAGLERLRSRWRATSANTYNCYMIDPTPSSGYGGEVAKFGGLLLVQVAPHIILLDGGESASQSLPILLQASFPLVTRQLCMKPSVKESVRMTHHTQKKILVTTFATSFKQSFTPHFIHLTRIFTCVTASRVSQTNLEQEISNQGFQTRRQVLLWIPRTSRR